MKNFVPENEWDKVRNMTKADIQVLFEYDRWANERVLKAMSAISAEQFTRNLSGSFGSLRDTFVHILYGEWIWLRYWRQRPGDPASLRAEAAEIFRPEKFPTIAEASSGWAEIVPVQTAFVDTVSEEALQEELPFRGGKLQLVQMMQHLANHGTYHRGQISLMIRQVGAEPLATDFHVFLVARSSDNVQNRHNAV